MSNHALGDGDRCIFRYYAGLRASLCVAVIAASIRPRRKRRRRDIARLVFTIESPRPAPADGERYIFNAGITIREIKREKKRARERERESGGEKKREEESRNVPSLYLPFSGSRDDLWKSLSALLGTVFKTLH